MPRPNLVIVCAATLALVLAGCDVNIEPTDLSAVTIENDRAVIEKTLGKPDKVVDAEGFTVAAYTYDYKGYYKSCLPQRNARGAQAAFVQGGLILICSVKIRGAKPRTQAKMAAVYDTDEKLLFAGYLYEANTTSEKLASLVNRYKATQTGDADALFSLSEIAFIPAQQRTFLQTAAEKGSAEAQYSVSYLVTEDADKIGWLRKAAAQGYTPAYKQLGKAYQAGTGVERDLEQARVWFAKAAENGDEEAAEAAEIAANLKAVIPHIDYTTPEGKYALALAYKRSNVLWVNFPEAERLLRESADEGYAPGQASYGDRILASRHDPIEALKWHRLAAEQGYAPSQTFVGQKYAFGGAGLSQNKVEALKWFILAAAQGDVIGQNNLSILSKDLSAKENAKALRLADEWQEAHPQ